ncbi:interleukin-13 receptor subunit alpha-1-like [Nerophis lumbriciformis]|uniref:interleukin-13 receptor subunit alpha-1-like n=1 Tax=Nerophis lumbriciformis TaxID=546530 RepID=UPI002ADFB733|nr:interleukin-13 receptor subunit alpha-1-like [Nerophis lumbriciformis]
MDRMSVISFACCFSFTLCSLSAEAGRLPVPENLSFNWLDPFTVNVSWQRPMGLSENRTIHYKYGPDNSSTVWENFTMTLLTEEAGASNWTFTVQTVSVDRGKADSSLHAPITISPQQPHAKLVADFRCLLQADRMDCSWIPVDPSVNLTLSYRVCGNKGPDMMCQRFHTSGVREGCSLSTRFVYEDVCMLAVSAAGMSTFKPEKVVSPPELTISVEGDKLNLSWAPLTVGWLCSWSYNVCYTRCNEIQPCEIYTPKEKTLQIAYHKSCLYEFRSKVSSGDECPSVYSDFSEVVIYGANRPPSVWLTVVAIVVPIVLCATVFLFCYCVRRAILYPVIPDPSAIFKDMMNGNKEIKIFTNLYTPVSEPIEPCKIIPPHGLFTAQVTHNSSGLIAEP